MTALPSTRNRKTVTDRTALAAGYRAYADLIERHPEVPIEAFPELTLWIHKTYGQPDDDRREKLAALLRVLPGAWTRKVEDYAPDNMDFLGWIEGLPARVIVGRDGVCERVVTGTREVTVTVPVGEDTRPVEEITQTVEDVEWVCSPILAADAVEVSA